MHAIYCTRSLEDVIWRWRVRKLLPRDLDIELIDNAARSNANDSTANMCSEAKTESRKHNNYQTDSVPIRATAITNAPVSITDKTGAVNSKKSNSISTTAINGSKNDNSPGSPSIYKNLWAKTQGALRSLGKFRIENTTGYRVDVHGLTSMATVDKCVARIGGVED